VNTNSRGTCTIILSSIYERAAMTVHGPINIIIIIIIIIINQMDHQCSVINMTHKSVLQDTNYKPYQDRSVITDRTVHNNRSDIVVLGKTTKEASQ
jgi:hypothetical protein